MVKHREQFNPNAIIGWAKATDVVVSGVDTEESRLVKSSVSNHRVSVVRGALKQVFEERQEELEQQLAIVQAELEVIKHALRVVSKGQRISQVPRTYSLEQFQEIPRTELGLNGLTLGNLKVRNRFTDDYVAFLGQIRELAPTTISPKAYGFSGSIARLILSPFAPRPNSYDPSSINHSVLSDRFFEHAPGESTTFVGGKNLENVNQLFSRRPSERVGNAVLEIFASLATQQQAGL